MYICILCQIVFHQKRIRGINGGFTLLFDVSCVNDKSPINRALIYLDLFRIYLSIEIKSITISLIPANGGW